MALGGNFYEKWRNLPEWAFCLNFWHYIKDFVIIQFITILKDHYLNFWQGSICFVNVIDISVGIELLLILEDFRTEGIIVLEAEAQKLETEFVGINPRSQTASLKPSSRFSYFEVLAQWLRNFFCKSIN